jgi:phosphatidylglycerol:prolipoprotein diacylglycerol transferase
LRPVLFHLAPGFAVHAYGALVAAGLILGAAIAVKEHQRYGVPAAITLSAALLGLAGAFLGGRILNAVVAGPLGLLSGGTAFLGGLVGGAGAVIGYGLVRGLRLGAMLDALALGLPCGHALGRLGCFMAGCCFGKQWSGPLAVRFPEGSLAARTLELAQRTPPLFPTQLAEAAAELALGAALFWLHARKRFHGQIAVAWLFGYGLIRFVLEVFRGDHVARGHLVEVRWSALAGALGLPGDEPLFLSTSQVIGFVLCAIALSCSALLPAARRTR